MACLASPPSPSPSPDQNNCPVLVAPRPVRLTSHVVFNRSSSTPVRLLSASPDPPRSPDPLSDKPLPSSRASPRSALSSEALEEFLSILRPSFFPPTSPTLRPRRPGSTLPPFHYERHFAFKSRPRIETVHRRTDIASPEDPDLCRSVNSSSRSSSRTPESGEPDVCPEIHAIQTEGVSYRWFPSTVLSSPISRMHTRNPFMKHVTSQSPSPVLNLSPAAVPLPLPTPDELLEIV
ncbi:hypothetical protein BDQ17DRAFT_1357695 [Cyathus striatus]|nr:hypothetical protein BDQ17DRAFT_1357695 [Cyathus striatus]